jgi:hypothetical protein
MTLILSGTDGLSDVDGTAAAPALRGTDTNTGIFFPAADTIAFAEGGAEAMRITSTGDVGIGTSSPTAKLTIDKSSDSASPSRTPADYSIRMTAASSNTYNGGVCVSESTFVNAAITPVDTGSGGAQGWAFITGNNTAIAEAARIDSSGNFLINTTSQFGSGKTCLLFDGNSFVGLSLQTTKATTGSTFTSFVNSAGSAAGTISHNGTTTVAYNTSSDYRLKENIAPMTGALAKVTALKPCTYKWKSDGTDGQGFIAHELDEVVQGCVTGAKDAVDAEGNPQYQGIDTSFLVATLTAAIQEQQALITALTTRITALEAA